MDLISNNYGYTELVEQRQKLDELAVSYYPGFRFSIVVYIQESSHVNSSRRATLERTGRHNSISYASAQKRKEVACAGDEVGLIASQIIC